MKIRSDFVTNSSSSSFIIDKKKYKGELSVDGVFLKIKELHKECQDMIRTVDKYLRTHGYKLKNGDIYATSGREKLSPYDLPHDLSDKVENEFDIDLYWIDDCGDLDGYKTYADYAAGGHNTAAGFSIVDYRASKAVMNYDAFEVLMWYLDGADYGCYGFEKEPDCTNCESTQWCEGIQYIKTKRREHGDPDMTVNEIMRRDMLSLGEICIHSREGQIGFNVVRRLKKICTYHCNHMG